MKTSFKKTFMFVITLLALTFGALGVTPALADITVANGMSASLVLGQPNFTSNTAATTQNGMSQGYSISVDPTTGKVFVADPGNNRVLRFASTTSLTNGANAEVVLGQSNFTSNAAATTQSGMSAPRSVFVDNTGTLWVGEIGNRRVTHFNNASSLSNGANADGVLGQPGFITNSQAWTSTGMWFVQGVFVDSSGTLWVADANRRVTRFNNAASKLNGAAADGVLGQPNFTTLLTTASASVIAGGAYQVFVDSAGRLWVADHTANRIMWFNNAASKLDGAAADGVLGQPDFVSTASGSGTSGMSSPTGISGDNGTGQIFVADRNNNRILVFNSAASKSNGAAADNVIGQADFSGTGAAVSATGLNNPYNIFFDQNAKTFWVGDVNNNRVLMYGTSCSSAITVTNNADSGAGSLRQAIADVCAGGTITFNNNYTITLTSGQLAVTKALTIDGGANAIVLDGNAYASRVINATAAITLSNLTIQNGGGVATGGGLYAGAPATITNVSFLNNKVTFQGGGVYLNDVATIDGSTFSGNQVTVWNNTAMGGAIRTAANVTIANSTFTNNSSANYAGAITDEPLAPASVLTISNSAFSGNTALVGGALTVWDTLDVSNSTFSGNTATSSPTSGGAMALVGVANLTNVTISGSTGSGIQGAATIDMSNSIIANSSGPDCSVTLTTNVNNLIKDSTCSPAVSGDPLLGALGNNGGTTTQTMALLPGSPAINAGNAPACAELLGGDFDQRGKSRVGTCDIGAFESQGFTLGSLTGTPQSATISTAFGTALGLTVTANNAGEPVNGGKVTFTPPGAGASAVITTSPATIAGGTVSVSATANGTAGGPYNVVASAAGATSVNFALTNTTTVTFNGNGSDGGSMSPQTASSTTALTSNGFTRTGYTFAGWNTNANGIAGTAFTNGQNYPFTASINIYAQWTINTYTVTYNGNTNTGGSAPTDGSSPYNYNSTVTVLGNINTAPLVKTGYTFNGWNTAANGSGTAYVASNTFTLGAANVILYAQWTVNGQTLTFNSNGGSPVTAITQSFGTAVTAPTNPTRIGYIFVGWYDEVGLTTLHTFSTMGLSTTVYAKWTVSIESPIITEGVSVNVIISEITSAAPFALTLHATDINSDPLTWSVLTPASYGTAGVDAATGVVSYVPGFNYNGLDSFVVQVSDGKGGTDSIIVNVTIDPGGPYRGTLIWNQSRQIKYDTWFGVSDSNATGDGYRKATSGDFIFKPKTATTSFKWITYRGPDQGKAQILVDGVVKATVDLYSATPQWQYMVEIKGLPNAKHKHTIVIRPLNLKNAQSTGKWVSVDGFEIGTTTYDDDQILSNLFSYKSWRGLQSSGVRFGAYRISTQKNAALSFSFDGVKFDWTTARGPKYGKAAIYVDGKLVKTVDLYKASQQWQYIETIDGLAYGHHTVIIKVLGTKNPASSGTGVVCDGFEIN